MGGSRLRWARQQAARPKPPSAINEGLRNMENYDIKLSRFEEALQRIRGFVRHTPMAPRPNLVDDMQEGLRFKLENMQVAGSFKARGVFNTLLQLTDEQKKRGIVASSGGNHGLAVAYAITRLGIPGVVVLPNTAAKDRVERVKQWAAEVIQYGDVWDDTHAKALERGAADGLYYIHPFDAEATIEGQGTTALEVLSDVPEVDCVLIAIGGGGLISGMSSVLKQAKPDVTVIGVEPEGAPTMERALKAGKPTQLPEVRTIADTLAPRCVSERTLALTQRFVDDIVLVSDDAMLDGMKWLWQSYNQIVEPSGAAVIAAIRSGKVSLDEFKNPVAIICGGNAAAEPLLSAYKVQALSRA